MRRSALAATLISAATVLAPAVATATPQHIGVAAHHACTRTSRGTCIQGGEFCKQSEYGHHGWDAEGRRYTCKGNRTHPHWEK
jgi:hypothetical protein